jgi:polyhydroxybutyrate depolymerase
MRSIVLLLLGLLMFAVVSAGCGEDDASEPLAEEAEQAVEPESGDQRADTQRQAQAQPEQPEESEESGEPEEQPAARQSEQPEPAPSEQDQSQQEQQAEAQTQQQQVQAQAEAEAETKLVIGGDRPATLLLPEEGDRSQPRPLIVLLHGYSSRSAEADAYFRFSQWVDKEEFGLLLPDGTVDEISNRFWNATEECCDIFGTEPDDVGYIKSLIDEAREIAEFDQVFAVGHSNGGFMAYRLACEDVPGLAGIVSLAGGAFADPEDCRAPAPLSVLQIHGTDDSIVLYEGGRLPAHPDPDRQPVPGAKDSVLRWAERADCDIDSAGVRPPIDTDSAVDGRETAVVRFSEGCADGTVMELWSVNGGSHIPLVWDTDFTPGILKWLAAIYDPSSVAGGPPSRSVSSHVIGGERQAELLLPEGREGEALPLILSLHGYQGDAAAHDWYFGLSERILGYNFALITPQGTDDQAGNPFWNATDGCCNFYDSDVDDYGWLTGLVAEVREIVDVSGVYVVGYSNGGFMSYRLACDGLDGLVAIASLAGSSFGDPERCADAMPISVLQIHGTDDQTIKSVAGEPIRHESAV